MIACSRRAGGCRRQFFNALIVISCWTPAAGAQTAPLEVSVGIGLLGGAAVGEWDAVLRANSQSEPTYRLFASDARFARAPAIEVRAGWRLARRFALEAHGMRAGQDLRVSVTADAEGAPPVTIAERVDRYIVGAGLIVLFEELRLGRLVPFAGAGAGYLRQVHEGATLVEQGHVYHFGAGVKRSLLTRSGHLLDGVGVRGDARVYLLHYGSAERSPQPHVSITGSVFLAF